MARYVVFTTRHHSGYSMFHTKASDFSIEHSPYGADITHQLIEAVRAEGLRVGLYYSLSDWHHLDYPAFEEPGHGDYDTPEQFLPTTPPSRPWELCLTMNESWGWRPSDTNYKSSRDLARSLADGASRGGNLLLNISPRGDGGLPDVQVSHLHDLGRWIATHGEAVIGVHPAPASVDFYGPATVGGNRLYLYLVAQPVENIIVRGIPVRRVLGADEPLRYRLPLAVYDDHLPGFDVLAELIIDAPAPSGALLDVIAIEFDGPLE